MKRAVLVIAIFTAFPAICLAEQPGKGDGAPGAALAKRYLTLGVGGGASVITGQIYSSNTSSLTTAGSMQFFIGAALGNFDVQFNFSWYLLRGDMIVPSYNRIAGTFNLYAAGIEGVWHPMRKAGTQGIDPYLRLGYSFLDLELENDLWNKYGIYNSIAIGQGPLVGAGVGYQLSWAPLDLDLGLDLAYQVIIMGNSAGNPVDGGALNIEFKAGFKF